MAAAPAGPAWGGWRLFALLAATSVLLTLTFMPQIPWRGPALEPGDISPGDFRAHRAFQVEDSAATAHLREAAAAAVKPVIDPVTMIADPAETEARRMEAAEAVAPALVTVKKGEVIAREGDPLTSLQIAKIEAMARARAMDSRWTTFLGTFLLVAVTLLAFHRVFVHMEPRQGKDFTRLLLLASILVAQAALTRVGLFVASAMGARYGFPESALAFGVPFALASMLVAPLFSTSVGVLVAGAASIFSAAANEWSLPTFIFSFVGGAVASFRAARCQQRTSMIKAGALVGLVNIATAAGLGLMAGGAGHAQWLYQLASAFAGGIGVALVASVALPLLEAASGIATDMSLMELANLNQPLLRSMMLSAPGTYHHSVMVGAMAEAAAEEIGANPVLARVAAYYHDVGKSGKPEYFVENQGGRPSRHDKLSPNMSALILMSHVKDGIELVRGARLPESVADIIHQHHGTRLIKFFYNRAKEQEDPAVQTVDERDFRYAGPKPQSKEAALIMLADQVEAAAKVLSDPTPARVKGVVQKIINDIFVDGQLDECDLTLRDLHFIAKSFTRSLTGMYHQRVDYPDTPGAADDRKEKTRKKGKDPDPDGKSVGEASAQAPGGTGTANIKRLGEK